MKWVHLAREVRQDALQRAATQVLGELRARQADQVHLETVAKKETTELMVCLGGKVVMVRLVTREVMGPRATMVTVDH